MTEQNRIKLMQLAQKHGFKRTPVVHYMMSVHNDDLIDFANAVLEMAALECEDQSIAKHGIHSFEYARAIRNLKGTN